MWVVMSGLVGLEGLAVGAAALVLARLEVAPLRLHLLVQLQLGVALGKLVSVLDEAGNEVGEKQRVHALALILGLHCHEQQIDHVVLSAQCLEQMHPAEWEQPATALD